MAFALGIGRFGEVVVDALMEKSIKIKIANKRHTDTGVYVGRPSPLGNPFRLRSEAEREAVIRSYERWLAEQIARGDAAICGELDRLYRKAVAEGEITLLCWCAPKACHAEVIAGVLRKALEERGYEVTILVGDAFRPR